MYIDTNTRNAYLKRLEKASDRWHDAGTPRKRINAARAGVALVQEAYLAGLISCRPGTANAIRWADRLAEAEGRPRSLPLRGAYITFERQKPWTTAEIGATQWRDGVCTERTAAIRTSYGLD